MKITIAYFKQVCEEMASNSKLHDNAMFDDLIKVNQDRLAALPADPIVKPSRFNLFSGKNKTAEEKSERRQCQEKIHSFIREKNQAQYRANKLVQLKEGADRFIESEIRKHKKKETSETDSRYDEEISPDSLSHAAAIVEEFLSSILQGNVGAMTGNQLLGELKMAIKANEPEKAPAVSLKP